MYRTLGGTLGSLAAYNRFRAYTTDRHRLHARSHVRLSHCLERPKVVTSPPP